MVVAGIEAQNTSRHWKCILDIRAQVAERKDWNLLGVK